MLESGIGNFFKKFIYFIYFWLRSVFLAAPGLSLVAASGVGATLGCGLLIAVASR